MPHTRNARTGNRAGRTVPAVSIAGRSGAGKTTLIEKLVPELSSLGYRVGTMKHHGSADEPGKDTFRHMAAGARKVALLSSGSVGIFSPAGSDPDPEEILAEYFSGVDIVIVEGFKSGPFPKIEVARAQLGRGLVISGADDLVAVVCDFEPGAGVPVFGLDDAPGIARFIEETFMTDKPKRDWKIRIRIDDKKIPMNRFVQDAFTGAITGLLSSLKDVPAEPGSIRIEIDRRGDAEDDAE